jgi:uncharacterized OB-fold protein
MKDDKTNLTEDQLTEANGGAQGGRIVGHRCKACGTEIMCHEPVYCNPCPKCGAIDYKPIKRIFDLW